MNRYMRTAGWCMAWPVTLAATAQAAQSSQTARSSPSGPKPAIAFVNVAVVPMDRERVLAGQTVIVRGNRIAAVGPAKRVAIPAGALRIDGRGKFLMPGLWDMHAHIDSPGDQDEALQDSLYRATYPRFIAHGVTGIREMAQRFPHGADSFRVWQRHVLAGRRVGPRAIGPSADVTFGNRISMSTPEDARRIVDSLKAAGDVFIKYHDDMGDPAVFFALAAEARKVGIPVLGHVSVDVSNVAAADSGMLSIEHVAEQHQCLPDWITRDGGVLNGGGPTTIDSAAVTARCAPVAAAYVRNGTWITPTLSSDLWLRGNLADNQQVVRILHGLGVRRFLAGTDSYTRMGFLLSNPRFLIGASAAEEVVLLAGAGLSPFEALQAATFNPAEYLHATDSLGAVAAGKVADLVLLDGNPLADIHNVGRLRAVVANGRYFDRAALDRLDPASLVLARQNMDELRRFGRVRAAALGLKLSDADNGNGEGRASRRLVVDSVAPKSGAAVAGIVPGDTLVTLDGDPVGGQDDFHLALLRRLPGDTVRLEVIGKGGVRRKVMAILDEDCRRTCR